MGTTETTIDQSRDLTIVKSTGKMSVYDFYEWIRDYYAGTVTQLIIWELGSMVPRSTSTERGALHPVRLPRDD